MSGKLSAKERLRRDRLEKLAKRCVDMEMGTHDYSPEGRPLRNPDGTPKYNMQEAMRGIYSLGYKNYKKALFEDPYFLRALDLERRNRTTGYVAAIEKIQRDSGAISTIAEGMCQRVLQAIGNDDVDVKLMLQHGPAWIRLAAEIEGKIKSGKEGKGDTLNVVYQDFRNLPAGARDRAAETMRAFHEGKLKEIQSALHHGAQDDDDVVEGEVVE